MNYYEHHIGDYAKATLHLTFVEDAAYSRLIRRYYSTEKPLPADLKEVQRVAGARTREERQAVEAVLKEFFELQDDGWHNGQLDQEIARFKEGEPEREVKKANEDNRIKRHRDERARLFKILTDAGQHAPWNIGMAELRDLVSRIAETKPVTPVQPLPVTAPVTPATATQSPSPNTHNPIIKEEDHLSVSTGANPATPPKVDEPPPERSDSKRHVEISVLLRAKGVKPFTFQHPFALEWAANPKVTDDILTAAVQSARDYKPTGDISPNYLKPIVDQLLNPPEPKAKPSEDWSWKKSDAGIDRKGRELGMFARPTESYRDYADRIEAEMAKRRGGKAA